MSWLSKTTGIHISPKGVRIEPLKALTTVASLATGGVGGALANLAKGAIARSAVGALKGDHGGDSSIPPAAFDTSLGRVAGGPAEQMAQPGLLDRAKDFITGNGGRNALGVLQGVNAALQQKKANDLSSRALRGVEGDYNARAPLRAAALESLMNPQTPDLAPLRATMNTGNPYAMGAQ